MENMSNSLEIEDKLNQIIKEYLTMAFDAGKESEREKWIVNQIKLSESYMKADRFETEKAELAMALINKAKETEELRARWEKLKKETDCLDVILLPNKNEMSIPDELKTLPLVKRMDIKCLIRELESGGNISEMGTEKDDEESMPDMPKTEEAKEESKSNLIPIKATSDNKIKFKCPECGKGYSYANSYRKHLKEMHEYDDIKIECEVNVPA